MNTKSNPTQGGAYTASGRTRAPRRDAAAPPAPTPETPIAAPPVKAARKSKSTAKR